MSQEKGKLIDPGEHGLRKMSGWEFEYALQVKMIEEWREAWEDPCPEEFADCLEVLMVAAKHHGIDWEKVIAARVDKVDKKGSFDHQWELSLK